MPHQPDDEDAEHGRDDRPVPRWHAPPRPRDSTPPAPTPGREPGTPAPVPEPVPAARLRDRLALPLLALALLLVAALVLRPAPRDETMRPAPLPPTVAPTPPRVVPLGVPRNNCFANLTLVAADTTLAVGRDAAEATARGGYDLPFRLGRLGTLADARLVTLGYAPDSFGAPVIQATQAAAIAGRLAWVLAFAATPALAVPAAPGNASATTMAYAAYALVDAATGAVLQICDVAEDTAAATGGPLPAVPPEGDRRRPVDVARAAVDFPARAATWLPFAPAASFARVDHLPGGEAEVVADYFAVPDGTTGARVRLISTTHAPLLATSVPGGTPVPRAAGQAARFDDLVMCAFRWRRGGDRRGESVELSPLQRPARRVFPASSRPPRLHSQYPRDPFLSSPSPR